MKKVFFEGSGTAPGNIRDIGAQEDFKKVLLLEELCSFPPLIQYFCFYERFAVFVF